MTDTDLDRLTLTELCCVRKEVEHHLIELDLAPAGAERVDVGKSPGAPVAQEEINALLVERGKADGLYISTAGVAVLEHDGPPTAPPARVAAGGTAACRPPSAIPGR